MTLETLYLPSCNRILQDENHRLSLLLLSALHQYCGVTLLEFQLPHLLLLYKLLSALCLISCFQLSCKCTTVTSESCLFCSCFLSTTSHFCTKYQCCYPPCFRKSLPHYQLLLSHFSPSRSQHFPGLPMQHCTKMLTTVHHSSLP